MKKMIQKLESFEDSKNGILMTRGFKDWNPFLKWIPKNYVMFPGQIKPQ